MSVTKLRIFQFGNALHTFDVHISSNIEKLRSLFDFLYILVFMGASISLFIKRSTLSESHETILFTVFRVILASC